MGTGGNCSHKRGKSYVTDKEAKLRDRALGRAKELVLMGSHRANKLLKDVQTYHDMPHEILVQKMHQITPPRTGGRYGERPCGNPQCSDYPKPRHIAVGFSSREQQATIISGNEDQRQSPAPSAAGSQAAASSQAARVDAEVDSNWAAPIWSQAEWYEATTPRPENSSPPRNNSPPRNIAAMTPLSIVKTPNETFDNGTPADLFISPHFKKWDLIAVSRREETPADKEDFAQETRRAE
jgi:hypothetical protein